MCKAVDREMVLTDIRLEHKSGGKSGVYERQSKPARTKQPR
jgi:cyclic pyranopterin phosphate synthase